jgi:hypothetical protein
VKESRVTLRLEFNVEVECDGAPTGPEWGYNGKPPGVMKARPVVDTTHPSVTLALQPSKDPGHCAPLHANMRTARAYHSRLLFRIPTRNL